MAANPTREMFLKQQSTNDLRDKQSRNVSADMLAKLNLVTPETAIKGGRLDRDAYLLSPGDHSITNLSAAKVVTSGLGDARIVTPVTVDSECAVFNALNFYGNSDFLVKVNNGASVIFNGCTFERNKASRTSNIPAAGLCFVLVEANGNAKFVGCAFLGGPSFAGYVIINLGVPANVEVIGCQNLTGVPI